MPRPATPIRRTPGLGESEGKKVNGGKEHANCERGSTRFGGLQGAGIRGFWQVSPSGCSTGVAYRPAGFSNVFHRALLKQVGNIPSLIS
jgi:hypothetical protein